MIVALEKDAHRSHVAILLRHGADPAAMDVNRMNAFDYALCGKSKPDLVALRQLLDCMFKNSPPALASDLEDFDEDDRVDEACAQLERMGFGGKDHDDDGASDGAETVVDGGEDVALVHQMPDAGFPQPLVQRSFLNRVVLPPFNLFCCFRRCSVIIQLIVC